MAIGNLTLSNRPTVLARVGTGDLKLPLAIQSQHRRNVAMRAVQFNVRVVVGYGQRDVVPTPDAREKTRGSRRQVAARKASDDAEHDQSSGTHEFTNSDLNSPSWLHERV